MSENTVTLTIDGKSITVPKGTLIIRAAEQLGTVIPRFCDHPLLDPVGACRQCIVEVEGQRKPMMACTTECGDGWEVKTHLTSEVAEKGQRGTLEFLLINHPLDCPMCDKGGECPLQDQALNHGSNSSRFIDDKRRYDKPVAVSEQVLLDRERCVLCARCTRFSEQISGDPFIELFERGALEQVAIYEDEPYHSYFSGNVIQICPVGALTSTGYRFKARPFDVRTAPSVCDHCSAGCSLTVQSRRGVIQRQLARTNMATNEMWSCDKGRFGFELLQSERRITEPKVKKSGELVGASWAEALTAATTAIKESLEQGAGRVAVVTGSRLADEDAYAVSKYARTVLQTDLIDFRTRFAPPSESAALSTLLTKPSATYADVEKSPTTLVIGLDPREEVPILFLRLRKAWRKHKAHLVPVGARAGSLEGLAWRWLQTDPAAEADALAAIGRALGIAAVADRAATSGFSAPHLSDVVEDLRSAGEDAVILVGERAGADTLAIAGLVADHLGAKLAWVPRRAGARGALEAGLAAGFLPGGRRLDDDDDRAEIEQHWGPLPVDSPGSDLHDILAAAVEGKIDVLHLIGVDLARDCASPDFAKKALDKVGTVIAQDLAHTETVDHADIVFPVEATQERDGQITDWEGRAQRFSLTIDGPDLVQPDWEIVTQLTALLGQDLGFHDLDGLRAERERVGRRTAPRSWPVPAVPEPAQEAEDEASLGLLTYPLLLDRGTMTADAHDLLKTSLPAFVGLAPADAERLGISSGDRVTVAGPDGQLELPAQIESGITPGTVYVPTNSTDTPATALSREGAGRVTVAVVQSDEVAAAAGEEAQ